MAIAGSRLSLVLSQPDTRSLAATATGLSNLCGPSIARSNSHSIHFRFQYLGIFSPSTLSLRDKAMTAIAIPATPTPTDIVANM